MIIVTYKSHYYGNLCLVAGKFVMFDSNPAAGRRLPLFIERSNDYLRLTMKLDVHGELKNGIENGEISHEQRLIETFS